MDAVPIAASLLCLAPIVTLGYATVCAVSPFRSCRRCAGYGLRGAGRGLRSRACPRCNGTGIRIRFGRHLFNELARIRRDGAR